MNKLLLFVSLFFSVSDGFALKSNPANFQCFAYHQETLNNPVNTGYSNGASRSSSVNQFIHVTQAITDPGKPLAFFISGDRGWTDFDQSLANRLAQKHIPCIGLDALHYFWSEKNPQKVAADIAPFIQNYMHTWGKSKILLVGYSFGADVLPFVADKLPFILKDKIQALALLSPSEKAGFEIHVSDMLSIGNRKDVYNVVDEIRRLKYFPTLCIFGKDEETKFPEKLRGKNIHFLFTQGGHHFSNSFDEIIRFIMKEM
ncbi:MAG: AcvB/VirJ family lysyl-phosphatidylglycerol hydrolase [Bacteroidota bacterium]|nr:AcvB/VirJ family lysyl-phosphatidylglycerol hydrolase [Bacteroidota bacterium]